MQVTAGERPTESAARLEVSVGNEAFEPGRTQVGLDASGRVEVISELEGSDARRAEAKLDPERATAMIKTARDAAARAARVGKRYGLPDEPRYHFEVGGERFDVWRSDLVEHPELQRVIATLQEVVGEQARGEIIL